MRRTGSGISSMNLYQRKKSRSLKLLPRYVKINNWKFESFHEIVPIYYPIGDFVRNTYDVCEPHFICQDNHNYNKIVWFISVLTVA